MDAIHSGCTQCESPGPAFVNDILQYSVLLYFRELNVLESQCIFHVLTLQGMWHVINRQLKLSSLIRPMNRFY